MSDLDLEPTDATPPISPLTQRVTRWQVRRRRLGVLWLWFVAGACTGALAIQRGRQAVRAAVDWLVSLVTP